jgi:hypothetical protein
MFNTDRNFGHGNSPESFIKAQALLEGPWRGGLVGLGKGDEIFPA